MKTATDMKSHWIKEGLADSTVRTYHGLLVRLLDHCMLVGDAPDDLTPETVREWSKSLCAGRATLGQAKACVSHWCEFTGQEDVSGAVDVPKKRRRMHRALPPEDAARLVEVAEQSGLKGLACLVGLYTAARRSEIATLSWPHIDFQRGVLTLERPKSNDLLDVPLHSALERHLLARKHFEGVWSWNSGVPPYVFVGANGGHVAAGTIWSWVKQVGAEAGLTITTHMLRHTALTMANDGTGDLRAAQELAGHAEPRTTAIYTRVSDQRKRAAVDAIDYGLPNVPKRGSKALSAR